MKLHVETIKGGLGDAIKTLNAEGLAEHVVTMLPQRSENVRGPVDPYDQYVVDVVLRLPDDHHLITGAFTI